MKKISAKHARMIENVSIVLLIATAVAVKLLDISIMYFMAVIIASGVALFIVAFKGEKGEGLSSNQTRFDLWIGIIPTIIIIIMFYSDDSFLVLSLGVLAIILLLFGNTIKKKWNQPFFQAEVSRKERATVAILNGVIIFALVMTMNFDTDVPKVQRVSVVAPTSEFVLENKSEWKKNYDLEQYYFPLKFRNESNYLYNEQSAKEKGISLTKEYHYEATFTLKDEQHTKEAWDVWIIPKPSTIEGDMNAKGYARKEGEDKIYILDEMEASMFYRHWKDR